VRTLFALLCAAGIGVNSVTLAKSVTSQPGGDAQQHFVAYVGLPLIIAVVLVVVIGYQRRARGIEWLVGFSAAPMLTLAAALPWRVERDLGIPAERRTRSPEAQRTPSQRAEYV
jgi:hypothetical protein